MRNEILRTKRPPKPPARQAGAEKAEAQAGAPSFGGDAEEEGEAMKYHITLDVTKASGWQTYEVEAETEAEAMEILKAGGGEFVDEEIEVYTHDYDNATVESIALE